MCEINRIFRKRIGFPESEKLSFVGLGTLLEKAAYAIPFENLAVIEGTAYEMTKENLKNKILMRNEGGLCYELNTILYFFLKENGFDVVLVPGVVFNDTVQNWSETGKTHVTILLKHEEQTFLIDTGFGVNLPLQPVPLNGQMIGTQTGEFRILNVESEHGDYIFEMKLKYKDRDWKIGYAFNSRTPIKSASELNGIQKIIREHHASSFNKGPLITIRTKRGHFTLTQSSYVQSADGVVKKEPINSEKFKELFIQFFPCNDGFHGLPI